MAYIIKSDQTVNDPTNKFEYITDLGLASKDLAVYFNEVKSQGYILTQIEFDALKAYEVGIKALGIWDNFIEFMPMFGNNINAQMVKMKFLNNQNGIALNSINDTFVDNSKGLIWANAAASNAPSINLGLTQNDILQGVGFGALVYQKPIALDIEDYSTIFGAGSSGFIGLKYYGTALGTLYNEVVNSTITGVTSWAGANTIFTKNLWNETLLTSLRSIYKNGVSLSSSTAPVQIVAGVFDSQFLSLGASATGATSTYKAFRGGIRLFAMHDSNIADANITSLQTLTDTFISATDKTFV